MADGTTSAEQLQCMTVWGGNGALQKWFALPALEVWVYNRPAGKQFGNTTCYVSSCASGRITRLLLAEPCGPEASVHGLSLQLGDLMAANVNQIQQKNFVRGLYETFTAAATDLGLATALVGSFFSPTRRLVYCNAGTPPPLTRAAGAGPVAGHTLCARRVHPPFLRTQLPSVGSRCVEYIWIRQPKELNMKLTEAA